MALPTWLQTYNPILYDRLNQSQVNARNQNPNAATFLDQKFAELDAAIAAYATVNKTDIYTVTVSALYNYFLANRNLGGPQINESSMEFEKVFTINNLEAAVPTTNSFNDLSQDAVTMEWSSPKLENAITVAKGGTDGTEDSYIRNTLVTPAVNSAQEAIQNAMFEEVTISGNPVGKRDNGIFIFETLRYKVGLEIFNITYKKPSYIS